MSIKRRQHSSKFKTQVVIAAIKGDKTIAQLSKEFNINQSRITAWKKIAFEGMPSLFDMRVKAVQSYSEHEIEKLYAQIGKLQVERDYLKKTYFNQPSKKEINVEPHKRNQHKTSEPIIRH